ncbi:lipopolysaccharide biosynthesis protein [Kitasatospora sp. MAP5-34]|uniref:YveK family protein n=1 Tax=Kitasatospora sp. MAP5-34 TaxID=3035102 RepID=UPI002476646E|nr:lipopolysaccharide biosynthesis protein [Kitasatospora sp. MAP5-34]MDH6578478.1 capsular polysaccharide biosynthesis protein [Kitasatospora sp. MAP5-34]
MPELRRSARALTRLWWPVALAVPLGAVAGAGYAVVSHPSYAANSYVVVVPQNPGEGSTAVNFAQAYGRLAGQPQVLAAAASETGRTVAAMAGLVSGTTSPDAPVIDITGTGRTPDSAVQAADAVAKSLISFANTSSKETGVKLVPLAAAAEPDAPTSPSAQLDTAVGGAAGLLIGALVMMTRRRPAEPGPVAEVPMPPRPRSGEPSGAEDAGNAGDTGDAKGAGDAGDAETVKGPQEAGSRR